MDSSKLSVAVIPEKVWLARIKEAIVSRIPETPKTPKTPSQPLRRACPGTHGPERTAALIRSGVRGSDPPFAEEKTGG